MGSATKQDFPGSASFWERERMLRQGKLYCSQRWPPTEVAMASTVRGFVLLSKNPGPQTGGVWFGPRPLPWTGQPKDS